jgi:hypothetical protein
MADDKKALETQLKILKQANSDLRAEQDGLLFKQRRNLVTAIKEQLEIEQSVTKNTASIKSISREIEGLKSDLEAVINQKIEGSTISPLSMGPPPAPPMGAPPAPPMGVPSAPPMSVPSAPPMSPTGSAAPRGFSGANKTIQTASIQELFNAFNRNDTSAPKTPSAEPKGNLKDALKQKPHLRKAETNQKIELSETEQITQLQVAIQKLQSNNDQIRASSAKLKTDIPRLESILLTAQKASADYMAVLEKQKPILSQLESNKVQLSKVLESVKEQITSKQTAIEEQLKAKQASIQAAPEATTIASPMGVPPAPPMGVPPAPSMGPAAPRGFAGANKTTQTASKKKSTTAEVVEEKVKATPAAMDLSDIGGTAAKMQAARDAKTLDEFLINKLTELAKNSSDILRVKLAVDEKQLSKLQIDLSNAINVASAPKPANNISSVLTAAMAKRRPHINDDDEDEDDEEYDPDEDNDTGKTVTPPVAVTSMTANPLNNVDEKQLSSEKAKQVVIAFISQNKTGLTKAADNCPNFNLTSAISPSLRVLQFLPFVLV